jgi:iron transport multicopper oxidase
MHISAFNFIMALSLLASLVSAGIVEQYWDVTWVWAAPDGYGRPVIGINGQWPCPDIYANKGDQIVVYLTNKLGNQTTGIHWHGINQISTTYMDGPTMTTQCPLPPNMTMRYAFTVSYPSSAFYRVSLLANVKTSTYPRPTPQAHTGVSDSRLGTTSVHI